MSTLVSWPRLGRALAAVAATAVVGLAASPPAGAHSFLIRSVPQAGARLVSSPAQLTLYFSERFVPGSESVVISRGGSDVSLPQPRVLGSVVTQPLPELKGVFVVHWRVLSDDGHISLGEFAFAVGSSAALPSVRGESAGTSWADVAGSWLVFIGLALALGGLLSERVVWRRTPARRTVAAAPVAVGIALAAGGALLELVLLAGNQRGGGFIAGLHEGALSDALATRPGKLSVAILVAFACAALLAPLRWLRVVAVLPLLVAVVLRAARGHSGTSGQGWAVAADAVHLAAVAVWLGALAHLILIVARAAEPRQALVDSARRYSRLALPTVLLALGTGVLTAIPEFRSVSTVVTTGYGQTLLVKAALIGLALLLALTARRRALPANPHPRLPLLRRLTLVEATLLAAALAVAALLVNLAPPRSSTASAAGAAPVLGPPPLEGPAVRLADLAGQLVVGMAASERELQFTIIAPGQAGAAEAKLQADAEPAEGKPLDLYPRPCGEGCFVIRYRVRGKTTITAEVSASGWTGGKVQFTVPWPLKPPADAALRRVARTMQAVPRLMLTESVTSGPGSGGRPAAYTLSGKAFMKTELYRSGAVDVRQISRDRGLTQLAFALPSSRIWYRIWFDARYRLRRELIISPGHLIRRSFRYGKSAAGARATPLPPTVLTPTGGVPPPAPGALTLGQEDGDLAVGLAVRPQRAALELQTTVLGPDGGGLSGLTVSYRVKARVRTAAAARPCGSGCYRARVRTSARPTLVSVRLAGAGRPPSTVEFALPRRWPPPAADGLVRRATNVFRGLQTLVIHERLASNPTNVLVTTYQLAAPDRLAYQIKGGAQAVIIGRRRWDRQPGGPWKESAQSPVRQPTPAWSAPFDAHVIGSARVGRRTAWLISFYDTRIPAFFTIAVDKTTLRTLELRMTAAAHFMHHRYTGFNAPVRIEPPG